MTDSSAAVQLFAPVAIRALLGELLTRFEPDLAVETVFDLNPIIPKRILAGEPFDAGITNPWYVDELIEAGRVDAGSHHPLGRVPLAMAGPVAKGQARDLDPAHVEPAASPLDAVRGLLTEARRIAYTADGTSGKTFLDVVERLGLTELIADRLVPMGPAYPVLSPVGALADGEVDIAIAPLTTILARPGIRHLASFPQELGTDIRMSMFASTASAGKPLAAALLQALADPALDDFLASRGMERFAFD